MREAQFNDALSLHVHQSCHLLIMGIYTGNKEDLKKETYIPTYRAEWFVEGVTQEFYC